MILNRAYKRFNRTPEQIEYSANNLDTIPFKDHPFKLLTGFYALVTILSLFVLIGLPLMHSSTDFSYAGFIDVGIIAICIPLIWRGSLNAIIVAGVVYIAGKLYASFTGPGIPALQLIMGLVCLAMTVDAFKTASFIKKRPTASVVTTDNVDTTGTL